MKPLVSVVISLFNKERFISATISSVLDQTYSNLEIIVVDDGSSDGGPAIVRSIKDKRIKLYEQLNAGPSAAQNLGFKFSSGQYIKFLDADDILTDEAIECQVHSLEGSRNCISYIEWEKFQEILPLPFEKNFRHTIHKSCLPIDYLTYKGEPQMLQSGQFLIPRSILVQSGLWKENLTLINDTEFYTRLFLSSDRLIFCERGLLFYRVIPHLNSVSQMINGNSLHSAIISIDLCASYLLAYEASDRIYVLLGKMYQMVLEWTYPDYNRLTKVLERRCNLVPKKYWVPTTSSKYFNILLKLLGWKSAKRARLIYYRFKY